MRTVLVVDDDPAIVQAIAMMLTRRGLHVHRAEAAAAALSILRAHWIDVLLVDFRMADMRGDVIFSAASAMQPQLKSQTIVMTGDITDAVLDAFGGTTCLVLLKPFLFEELERSIATVLARSMSRPNSAAGGGG